MNPVSQRLLSQQLICPQFSTPREVVSWMGAMQAQYLTDEARTRGFQKGRCLLLAPYDEYLISYKSRDIVLHPDHTPRAHNNTGNFWPVFLLDGQVSGNWAATKDKVTLTPFCPDYVPSQESRENEITRYLDYLKR